MRVWLTTTTTTIKKRCRRRHRSRSLISRIIYFMLVQEDVECLPKRNFVNRAYPLPLLEVRLHLGGGGGGSLAPDFLYFFIIRAIRKY